MSPAVVGQPALPRLRGRSPELLEVLESVQIGRANTRQELLRQTGLSRNIVTRRVAELIRLGLLVEDGAALSTGGRAPRHLRIAGEIGRVLAVDLGATSLVVAIADLSGQILTSTEIAYDVDGPPTLTLDAIDALAGPQLAATDSGGPELLGMGVGVPGPVAFPEGILVAPPLMPKWDGYPLRAEMERRYDIPVWVDNDVNMMALGELRAGKLRNAEFGLVIKVGTGIGAGITTNGAIHRGARGCAGDVGHVHVPDAQPIPCRCGGVGCLEAVAGGRAIAQRAVEAAQAATSPVLAERFAATGQLTSEDVGWAAQRGDVTSMGILQHASRLVGEMLATVVSTLNPDVIVVDGGVAKAGDLFLAGIRREVHRLAPPLATRSLLIETSALSGHSGIIGAAWLAIGGLCSGTFVPLPAGNGSRNKRKVTR